MSIAIEGKSSICAHTVSWSYEVHDLEETEELRNRLEEEAESRAKEMIIIGNNCGELNCLWMGEVEIRGWWQID